MTQPTACVAALVLLAISARVSALNAPLDISQYGHTAWTTRDGFVGRAQTFAQTRDGYLWVGGNGGLFRFDGIRWVPWTLPAARNSAANQDVNDLLAARDGTLWINRTSELVSWKDGRFTQYSPPAGKEFFWLAEDRDGRTWTSVYAPAGMCVVDAGDVHCSNGGVNLGPAVSRIFENSKGELWAGLADGWMRWRPGPPSVFTHGRLAGPARFPTGHPNGYGGIAEEKGDLLVGIPEGIVRFVDGKTELVHRSPFDSNPFAPTALLVDADGALWAGDFGRGLVHHHDGRTDVFTNLDGLSSNSVFALFEDREGSVWVGTNGGVDRFRDVAVARYSVAQGLSHDSIAAVLAARDGSVWISTVAGLNHVNRGRVTIYRERPGPTSPGVREIAARRFPERSQALFQDSRGRIWVSGVRGAGYLDGDRYVPVLDTEARSDIFVASIREDRGGDIWIATNEGDEGIVRVRDDRIVERIPRSALGAGSDSRHPFAVADPLRGGLWVGFFTGGGVVRLVDGRVQASYSAADGLGRGAVRHLRVAADGSVWVSTEGGLSRLDDRRIATLDSGSGLPCDGVFWSVEDATGSLWVYMACGLVRIAKSEVDSWVGASARDARPDSVRFTMLGAADGIPALPLVRPFVPPVSETPDGRIWFSMLDSVGVIDPRNLRVNTLAPPVQIEQLVADGIRFDAASDLRLPPLVRDLQIDYTALSLVAPERNMFRVMLEGRDTDWQDVGTRRQAFYTDLGPGTYRFRVVASNNSGVWNETGATREFSIAPAYYQTRSFAALVVIGTAMLLWAAHQVRMRQVAHQFNRTLDARVSERTRIARDLHDTLLQSLQGLLLRFHSALKLLPARPDEARERLKRALDLVEAAITESRNAVQGMRASATTVNDLANDIAAIGAELTSDPSAASPPTIDVHVDGSSRDLNPVVREEAYRIAGEAVRNAFKHAQARHITVAIHYEPKQLRLTVNDDGKGMDEAVMRRQTGHFGLSGMRERASIVNGQLDVRSAPGAGTAIELRVPGATAYRFSGRSWWASLLGR